MSHRCESGPQNMPMKNIVSRVPSCRSPPELLGLEFPVNMLVYKAHNE
jgi:hypothetical protein